MALDLNNYLPPDPDERGKTANIFAKIIYDLYRSRSHLASIEADYGELGKIVVREIVVSTTVYMTIYLIFVSLICIASVHSLHFCNISNQKVAGACAFFGLYFITFSFWYVMTRIGYKKIVTKQNYGKKEEELKAIASEIESKVQSGKIKKLNRYLFISPFALRTIWLWVLITGFITALLDEKVNFILTIESVYPFAQAFLKTLVLVIISYIATNIISELLNLREQYVKGRKEMETLEESTKRINAQIQKTSDLIAENNNNIKFANEVIPIANALKDLEYSLKKPKSVSLPKSFTNFINTLKGQISIYQDKLGSSTDETVNLWTLSALYTNIKLQAEIFKDRDTLITEFQLFGKILKESLLNIMVAKIDDNWEYEIYTVLVLPPSRFLNFKRNFDNDNKDNYATDENWQDFIKTIQQATLRKLKHHRHFVSLSGKENIIKDLFSESDSLLKSNVQNELKKEYSYNLDTGVYFKEIQFQGIKYYQYPEFSKEQPEKHESKALDFILDKYHCDDCCKILEIEILKDTDKFKLDNILYDKRTKKPIDYYAIRDINNNKWILCFRTIYDETFDFAHINILHNEQQNKSEWNTLVDHLNNIFCLDSKCLTEGSIKVNKSLGIKIYPINEYA